MMISVHRKFLNANIACATQFANLAFLKDGTGVSGTCQDFCTSEGAIFSLRKVRKENAFGQIPQSSILRASLDIYGPRQKPYLIQFMISEVKRDFFPFSDAQSAEPSKDLEKPRDSFQTVLHDREG